MGNQTSSTDLLTTFNLIMNNLNPNLRAKKRVVDTSCSSTSPKYFATTPVQLLKLNRSHMNLHIKSPRNQAEFVKKTSATPSGSSTKGCKFQESFDKIFRLSYNSFSSIDSLVMKSKNEVAELISSQYLQNENFLQAEVKNIFAVQKRMIYELLAELIENEKKKKKSDSESFFLDLNPEIDSVVAELSKSKEIIRKVHMDLSKKIPLIKDFEEKVQRLNSECEIEKQKYEEQNRFAIELTYERDNLLNSIQNLSDFVNSQNSWVERSQKTMEKESGKEKSEKKRLEIALKENQELKSSLELATHNFKHLCGKFSVQKEQFFKYKYDRESKKNEYEENMKILLEKIEKIAPKVTEKQSTPMETVAFMLDLTEKVLAENSLKLEEFSKELSKSKEEINELNQNKTRILSKSQQFEEELRVVYDKLFEINKDKEKAVIELICVQETYKKEKSRLESEIKTCLTREKILERDSDYKEDQIQKLQQSIDKVHFDRSEEIRFIIEGCKEKTIQDIGDLQKALEAKENELKDHGRLKLLSKIQQSSIEELQRKNENLEVFIEKNKKIAEERENTISDLKIRVVSQSNVNKKIRETIKTMRSEIIENYQSQLEKKNKQISELEESLSENEKANIIFQENKNLNHLKIEDFLEKELKICEQVVQIQNEKLRNKIFALRNEYSEIVDINLNQFKGKEIQETIGENKEFEIGTFRDKFLMRVTQERNELMDEIFEFVESVKNECLNLKVFSKNVQKEYEKALEKTGEIAVFEELLRGKEKENLKMQEKCKKYEKEILKIEESSRAKDLKNKELTESYQNSHAMMGSSIRDLKKVIKKKYKTKYFNNLLAKDNELINLRIAHEELIKQSSDEVNQLKHQEVVLFNYSNQLDKLYEDLSAAEELIERYKSQNQEDENTIYNLNQELINYSMENEDLKETRQKLVLEKEAIAGEKDFTIGNLQKTIQELRIYEESLDESIIENSSEHVYKLLRELKEKDMIIKKSNKRVLDMQWKNRDLIDTLSDYEKKIAEFLENTEKSSFENYELFQENERFSKEIAELRERFEKSKVSNMEISEKNKILIEE